MNIRGRAIFSNLLLPLHLRVKRFLTFLYPANSQYVFLVRDIRVVWPFSRHTATTFD